MKAPARTLPATALLSLLCTASATAHAADGDSWDWMVEPYLWAAGVTTDLRTPQSPDPIVGETSFRDLVDKLEGAAQLRVEGRGDRFGAFVDFTYMGLGDDNQWAQVATESDLDMILVDAAVSFRPGGDRLTGLDLFAGVRYLDVDLTVDYAPNDPAQASGRIDAGNSYTDFLAGARHSWAFSERWGMAARADASTGDTDDSWSAGVTGHYRTGNGAWLFGYRHLQVKLSSSGANTTITMSGPSVGYGFVF